MIKELFHPESGPGSKKAHLPRLNAWLLLLWSETWKCMIQFDEHIFRILWENSITSCQDIWDQILPCWVVAWLQVWETQKRRHEKNKWWELLWKILTLLGTNISPTSRHFWVDDDSIHIILFGGICDGSVKRKGFSKSFVQNGGF